MPCATLSSADSSSLPSSRSSRSARHASWRSISIEHRFSLVQKIFDKTVSGGALIVVEKILGKNAHLDDIFVDIYLKRKRNNGYSDEEIQRKRLALEGVLVPMTAKANEEMLFDAGFERVECFWRWMNFAGWVAIKK